MHKYLIVILIVLFSPLCHGQSLLSSLDNFDSKKFLQEVKQLDQFMKRFNNQENILTGKEKSSSEIIIEKEKLDVYQESRMKLLTSLLNLEDSSLYNGSTIEFINFVGEESNHTVIEYTDLDWFATVNCKMIYRGQKQNIILTLKNQGDSHNGYKWVIAGVQADFINIDASRKDTSIFIGPMNHELGFMDLFKVFGDAKNIPEYTYQQFYADELSVFLFLVKSKELQYLEVNSIKYHFLQIKNWIFTVDYFNRKNANSGWLISSIQKYTDTDKLNYKRSVLSIK